MRKYLEAVTLGAFSFRGGNGRSGENAEAFVESVSVVKTPWLWLHFFIVTVALNFPVMVIIARLPPWELFSRLYGAEFAAMLPEAAREFLAQSSAAAEAAGIDQALIDDFNVFMLQSGYGKTVLLPLLFLAFGVILILQAAFYLFAALCVGLQRMTLSQLKFRDRLGLLLFSSTLPVFLAAILGLWLPTVHIIVFYFAVILIGFYRSNAAVTAAAD
jgi:hypothetical protein